LDIYSVLISLYPINPYDYIIILLGLLIYLMILVLERSLIVVESADEGIWPGAFM